MATTNVSRKFSPRLSQASGNGHGSTPRVQFALEPAIIEFTGYTDGFLTPTVRVWKNGRELDFGGYTAIVTSGSAVPSELRFRMDGRHVAPLLWRNLKEYVTARVFLPARYNKRYLGYLYMDGQGHDHVHFRPYDMVLATGLAGFLRVCQEAATGEKDIDAISEHIRNGSQAGLLRQVVDTNFVAQCLTLIRSYGQPYGGRRAALEEQLATALDGAGRLSRYAASSDRPLGSRKVAQQQAGAAAAPARAMAGFRIGARPGASPLVQLRNSLRTVAR